MAKKSGASVHWGGLDKNFMAAAIKLGQTGELLDNIGEALVSGTIDRFDKEIDPDGQAWKESRRAKAESGKTLLDTGKLRNSVSYEVSGNDSVKVGSVSKYARIHQFGGVIKPKAKKALAFNGSDGGIRIAKQVKMPARPFIGISQGDKEEIADAITSFIAGAFK